MRGPAARQHRLDAPPSQPGAMPIRVIAPIAVHTLGPTAGSAAFAAYRGNAVHQGLQGGDVIRVRPGQPHRQGDPLGIGDQVVLAARLGFVRGIRPGLAPPFRARTEALSTTARDQSIWPAPWSLASKTACSRCQTPAACHSRNRRQQVIPLPQPISWGKSSQPMPVFKTNKMPVRAWRLSIRFRPGCRNRRGGGGGRIGPTIAHKSSSTRGFAIRSAPGSLQAVISAVSVSPFVHSVRSSKGLADP